MDSDRFESLARRVGAAVTRRGALAALLAGVLAGLPGVALPDESTAARRKHKNSPSRGNGRRRKGQRPARRNDKRSRSRTSAASEARAATACCSGGNCTPGKGKNLSKCCYRGQDLSGKNFQGANLGSADFSRATLTNANLHAANLDKACFVDADLTGARINNSTHLSGAILCRTVMPDGSANSSGCGRGTPCCATCDAAHPCGSGSVCCAGRCIPGDCCDNGQQSTCGEGALCCANRCADGDCCVAADCPNRTCERRACEDNQCVYTTVFGQPGPRCQTTCCETGQREPVCCAAGVTNCQPSGICGCGGDGDCGADQRCCAGTCVPKTRCCEGDNAEGCAANLHCCVVSGSGVCRACCDAGQCPDETCETKRCAANGTCAYTPVFGDAGPGCATVCCENADDQPVCCPDGTAVCTASGRCRCDGAADCAANQICCNGICIANTRCCNNDPSTCPAVGVCQVRACADGACQPQGVTGGTCPFASGGTGACSQGVCICPSPRVTCSNGCCAAGVPGCNTDGTCGAVCDVCPSGCPFTTLAAAVAATPDGGTIRLCPGTYPTNAVSIAKNLTVIGAGSGSDPAVDTILTGGNTSRVLTILDATVAIRDLTVTGGKGADRCGGIEVVLNATLTLERVEVIGNTSDVSSTGGNSGGGLNVFAGSTAIVKASRFANNTTQGGASAVGGGIFNGGALTVESTRIERNSAEGGAGIFNGRNARLTLNAGAIITTNTATDPTPSGGGIYNIGTIVDNDAAINITGNIPDNCISEAPGTGCPA